MTSMAPTQPTRHDVTSVSSRFLDDVLRCLSTPQKTLPSKYFYDAEGSRLFEAICELPEYYLTRTETALLAGIAPALAGFVADGAAFVEFGSGASAKTRLILDASPQIDLYVPIDISEAALSRTAETISADYHGLKSDASRRGLHPCHAAALGYAQPPNRRFLPWFDDREFPAS